MLTGTIKARRLAAAATLAALPLFAGAVQGDADPASTHAAQASRDAEHGSGPQWSYILGEYGGDRTACWGLGGWAEVWCRVYAL